MASADVELATLQHDTADDAKQDLADKQPAAGPVFSPTRQLTTPPLSVPADVFLRNRPTAPSFWYHHREHIYSLPVVSVQLTINIHVSTAMVHLRVVFANTSTRKVDGIFALPLRGTVTSVEAQIGDNRYLQSEIIDNDDMAVLSNRLAPPRVSAHIPLENLSEYVPELFRLPVLGLSAGEFVTLDIDYIEPLSFFQGSYGLNVPLKFAAELLPPDLGANETFLSVEGAVYALAENAEILSTTHALEITELGTHKTFRVVSTEPDMELFNVHFSLHLSDVIGQVVKQADVRAPAPGSSSSTSSSSRAAGEPVESKDGGDGADDGAGDEPAGETGSFVAFVTPPSLDSLEKQFRRNFVFLLDRSGSMVGPPFEEALRGLQAALSKLGPYDKFNVMAFDHNMMAVCEEMIPATPKNLEIAFNWVADKKPAMGGTTFEPPLRWALSLLEKSTKGLNFVFLLTDGAVDNEREICQLAAQAAGRTRVLTFGIGTYCNWYFLRMLATMTRGMSASVVYQEQIFDQVSHLLTMAEMPVLTDLGIEMEGVEECQLYPFPLPDLFMGAPLLVAGSYRATETFPDSIALTGTDATGRNRTTDLLVHTNPEVPVERVFLKQRMDLLVAKAWLENSRELRQQVVDLSIGAGMPSPYTTMVAFEVPANERGRWSEERQADDLDRKKLASLVRTSRQRSERRARLIAATAVGGVVAVGAAVIAFGNIGATVANVAAVVAGGVGSLATSAVHCCAECDCGICVECIGALNCC